MTEGDNDRLHLQELEALDEKGLLAQHNIELYQARILKAFTKSQRENLPARRFSLSCPTTHDHDAQD